MGMGNDWPNILDPNGGKGIGTAFYNFRQNVNQLFINIKYTFQDVINGGELEEVTCIGDASKFKPPKTKHFGIKYGEHWFGLGLGSDSKRIEFSKTPHPEGDNMVDLFIWDNTMLTQGISITIEQIKSTIDYFRNRDEKKPLEPIQPNKPQLKNTYVGPGTMGYNVHGDPIPSHDSLLQYSHGNDSIWKTCKWGDKDTTILHTEQIIRH